MQPQDIMVVIIVVDNAPVLGVVVARSKRTTLMALEVNIVPDGQQQCRGGIKDNGVIRRHHDKDLAFLKEDLSYLCQLEMLLHYDMLACPATAPLVALSVLFFVSVLKQSRNCCLNNFTETVRKRINWSINRGNGTSSSLRETMPARSLAMADAVMFSRVPPPPPLWLWGCPLAWMNHFFFKVSQVVSSCLKLSQVVSSCLRCLKVSQSVSMCLSVSQSLSGKGTLVISLRM
jgi:hypothetical protein